MTTRVGRVGGRRLPAEVTSFVGRRRELAEIKRLLESTRLLTLTGAGGCGKSRFALRTADDFARAFPHGVYLAELASLADPAVVANVFFDALDVRDQTSTWPVATLTAYIASKRLLLVVDNGKHLLDACAVLMGAMLRVCPELRILATGREPLSIPGETTYRVPSLSLPEPDQKLDKAAGIWRAYESLALFEDRAAAVGTQAVSGLPGHAGARNYVEMRCAGQCLAPPGGSKVRLYIRCRPQQADGITGASQHSNLGHSVSH